MVYRVRTEKPKECDRCGSDRKKTIFGEVRCDDCGHVLVNIPKKQPKHRAKSTFTKKECKKCGDPFTPSSGVQHWCYNCTTATCAHCKNSFRRAGTIGRFCSKYCADEFTRGKKVVGRKPISKEKRQRINDAIRAKYQSEEGAAYKLRISEATKLAMQRPDVQEKIRAPRSALSLEQRMLLSDRNAGKMPKNIMGTPGKYGNVQRGWFDINGTTMYFRSKWEANYALYLDWLIDHKQIYKWEFEPDTFMFENIKLGTRSYTPDFKVYTDEDSYEYHEVKGYMDSKSKTKLKRFKKYYPEHKLVLIDKTVYNELKKQVGKLCKFY